MSFKRLGLFVNPIVIVNSAKFYAPLLAQLENAIAEHFMDTRHRDLWSVVDEPEEVLPIARIVRPWPNDAQRFAVP